MGTSASHPGSGANTPLIPPWADPENPEPSPAAAPRRFRDFRNNLGRFATTGNEANLHAALRHFAGKALGGPVPGARRFTAMMGAGADAIAAFRGPGGIAAGLANAGVDLSALRGANLETVIETIARAFSPDNADHDKVEEALRAALTEVLQNVDAFNVETFQGFADETYAHLIAQFIENCVLVQVLSEGGIAWDRAGDGMKQQAREDQLRQTIRVEVGHQLQLHADQSLTAMTRDAMAAVQVAVVAGVLKSWENYDA